ncbi:hypothetical protein, partial [Porphyromonas loveana]|uniref:hypothetical protein n=1 Tax=Porphyromonas loveana TaxID=1884669 RepID=UPI0035A1177D
GHPYRHLTIRPADKSKREFGPPPKKTASQCPKSVRWYLLRGSREDNPYMMQLPFVDTFRKREPEQP